MKKTLLILGAILGVAGTIACTVMVIMAARFMELGRVVFYLVIGIACIEVAVLSITGLYKEIKKKQ